MNKSDFYYDLPPGRIAQKPAVPRDSSRLMVLHRGSEEIGHRHFYDLPDLLQPGDLLVLNDTKVLPARLLGRKKASGGSCELLLLHQLEDGCWEALAKPGRRLQPGTQLFFGAGELEATVLENLEEGRKKVRFNMTGGAFFAALDSLGQMPLPPYIKEPIRHGSEYQTIYAKLPGSAAAPTAGLHFTQDVFGRLADRGIKTTEVTLHVGLGTFRPVKAEQVENHTMHNEWYSISENAAKTINAAKRSGNRVIAVGTTSCRTLESATDEAGVLQPGSGDTSIFIYPGYQFKVIDALLTNFHLPESTLIMLVAALYGLEPTMKAYNEAVRLQYRFFSFGDAMLLF